MKAGKMKTKIEVEAFTLVEDEDYGSLEKQWEPLLIRHAQKLTLTGKEYYISDQLFAESSHKFLLRWDLVASQITNAHRLKVGSSYFDIKKCFDPKDDRRGLIIVANEVT